jgi:hypothetical protein
MYLSANYKAVIAQVSGWLLYLQESVDGVSVVVRDQGYAIEANALAFWLILLSNW